MRPTARKTLKIIDLPPPTVELRLSPTVGCGIGLAWVREHLSRPGSNIQIRLASGEDVTGEILDHAAYDPKGERLKS